MKGEERFAQAFIDSTYTDWCALSMLSDWFLEHGDALMARALRWMVGNRRRPERGGLLFQRYLWTTARIRRPDEAEESELPFELWDELTASPRYDSEGTPSESFLAAVSRLGIVLEKTGYDRAPDPA